MHLTPIRQEFLNMEGDTLESSYRLQVEDKESVVVIGQFDTFYELYKMLCLEVNGPAILLEFLEKHGEEEAAEDIRQNGVAICGRYYEQDATTQD